MTLERFREATLGEAREDAEAKLAAARAAADEHRERCEAEATKLVEQASADGRDAASRELVAEERMARRHARELVLRARRALYDQARGEAIEELRRRRGSAEYQALHAAMERLMREQLGPEVVCSEAADAEGGIIGEAGGRRVTYSLAALVDEELRRRGVEVEQLWR
jgi:vacuolar-type H+-ATPase subunit E/Vma4